jgi:hypothetical protein
LSGERRHIFICFSSRDVEIARELVGDLEASGLNCWISIRDLGPGQNYQEAIVQALESAGAVIFLFSESSNQSSEIKKELAISSSINTPVFPVRLSPIAPSGALRYELATRQWIDLFPDRAAAVGQLATSLRRALGETSGSLSDQRSASGGSVAPYVAAMVRKPASPQVTGEQMEALRLLLARRIGPIAKVLLRKAASEGISYDDLLIRLSAHVQAGSDREAFLNSARALAPSGPR